uniref:Probable leucine-rich repeat receptor-like protein kinase At1g68400 n=1 Tax=Tanacetum cinerariifolium TaxID=118510 RepID=A0A6L2P4M4_TANCI|nr:probable leucine-rich repeat receptor-like protein kinase At1g68400 [Tanacetum cinerariifolium]
MPSHLLLLILHVTLIHAAAAPPYNHPDLTTLLSFKTTSDISNNLSSWNMSLDPCGKTSFLGVTCLHNRVTGLVLEGLSLHGSFESLTGLGKLRVLSLKHNQLTGPFPDFSNLTSLKLVFLSDNRISGEFPRVLPDLFRLDLANNDIYGEIPVTVNKMTRLLTLRLEGNRVSGSIHFLNITSLRDFNISGNNVSGEIPASLSGFPGSVFGNNPVLCGFPLSECVPPKIPSNVVSSSPTSVPWTAEVPKRPGNSHKGGKISTLAIAAIIIGDVLVLALVSLLLYCYFAGEKINEKNKNNVEGEKMIYVNSGVNSFEKGRMVFFDDARRFELEDLLRASAEMLGKGGLGTAYKAVLDDRNVVAVKRLKDVVIGGGKREFEQQMEVLGRLRHPNVVSLKAYYFAKDEKLIVYDYMTNGNLFWLLHGTFKLTITSTMLHLKSSGY